MFLNALIEIRALTEATLDFPEEEIDFIEQHDVFNRLEKILTNIEEVKKAAQQGSIIRDGLTVVLVGQPNVGKSSLMNASPCGLSTRPTATKNATTRSTSPMA